MPLPLTLRKVWGYGLGLALAALAACYFVPMPARALDTVYTVVTLPAIGGSAVLALWRAREGLGQERVAWRLIGLGGIAWFIGEAGWAWTAVLLQQEVGFPHWTDVFYLLNVPLMVAGVLALAWRRGTRHAGIQALDAIMVAGALFAFAWVLFIRGTVTADAPGTLGVAVTLAYPVGDVAILAALVLAMTRLDPGRRRQLWPLAAGLMAIVVADSAYSAYVLHFGAYGATLFDLGWGLGAYGIGAAALRPARDAVARRGSASRLEEYAPGLTLLPAIVAGVWDVAGTGTLDDVTVLTGVAIVAALLARQALFLDSHVRLSRDLEHATRLAGLGTWRTDRSGRLVLDEGAARLTATSADAPPTLARLAQALAPADPEALLRDIEGLAAGQALERSLPVGEGATARHLQLRVRRAADGTLQATLLDISDEVRLEQERQRNHAHRQEAERQAELARAKTQFINTAAHELNTPLTPIRLSLASLKQSTPSAPLAILERNVDRLARLLHDVLEGARLQADHLRLERRPMDLAQLVRESVEEHQPTAAARDVLLRVEAAAAVNVLGDGARLHEVVMNLLSNALKFTPEGGRVVARVTRESGFGRVEVIDSGRGIKEGDLALLFQPFTQVGQVTTGGTGLGLYISRGIVEKHGGTISAVSPGEGKGATFAFTIPLATDGAAAVAA